jgi:Flp pilus assembly protein TadG
MKRIKDESGQALIMVALSLTCILGFVGFATDVGVLLHAKRNLQIAADAAALAGANWIRVKGAGAAEITAAAKAASAQNGFTDGVNGTTVTPSYPAADGPHAGKLGYAEAIVTQTQPTFFMRLFSFSSVPVSARAVAFNGANTNTACLDAINGSLPDTINLQGHFNVEAPNCQVIDNSRSQSALNFTGNAGSLTAGSVGVVGGVAGFATDSNPIPVKVPQSSDPLANTVKNLTAADWGTCSSPPSGSTWGSANGGITCYSGNNSIGNTVTMLPGVYVFTGTLGLQGHGNLNGTGVTIYLAAPNGSMDMGGAGNATLGALSAPKGDPTNPWNNILIYEEPADTHPVNMEGTPISTLSGIIYLPSAMLELGGNGSLSQNLNVNMVVNQFFAFGNATVNISNYTSTVTDSPLNTIALVE